MEAKFAKVEDEKVVKSEPDVLEQDIRNIFGEEKKDMKEEQGMVEEPRAENGKKESGEGERSQEDVVDWKNLFERMQEHYYMKKREWEVEKEKLHNELLSQKEKREEVEKALWKRVGIEEGKRQALEDQVKHLQTEKEKALERARQLREKGKGGGKNNAD